ncbi:putative 3-phosphoshikimate 1-carboxyvinyltransferase [Actinobacillus pleuropneumoniae]|uniref:3-phosphoshikimate 1-carboxyvinyltransferase n=2 Tax=Actinobacillus pleuropneumoniae TaxID=715 RepID=AROA_ACTP7|nr:3-phosphoshikimate 1-carboxyvinyltransferase [Actinobacillus pleuropneumoniae]B0BNY1.1 RecName: Full=3-phosphoshikimate 1-carboxyvinyltransferase; AltName: Full=5-enolpyruvylshikimate-3-phosphate synthase; Short=EPSP synthase; Short=EPSPS [Actinobacillus pleuropneumoniae serovar 3 str. JL03]B3GXD4.1 RecName: Full=3-phosphoshikimate 1-carboxyvinyltransferase; AltName: Full=5-enolpyruvylshikimate-3-phosphate synthase; Short=EPSP synthase; Short=EPSPS [Actinobacillus pleuropneumoniae serovar 7 st
MEKITLAPISRVEGEINLPGSKSLSNRALLLAALAKGTTKVTNLLDSDDIRHMLNALKALGVNYSLSEDKTVCTVEGVGGAFNWKNGLALFLGNAGTAMRPLTAALCLKGATEAEVVLTGEPRMKERPIKHLVDALRQAGASVQYLENEGYPPVAIRNSGLKGGKVQIDGSISSQFLTALLMAAPLAEGDMEIEIIGELVSKPYIDITLAMMKDFGVKVENRNYQTFVVKGNQSYLSPEKYLVEGDASSASYFLAAGAIKGKVKVTGIGKNSIQGDRLFANVLEAMGAKITWGDDFIQAEQGKLKGVDMDMNHIPDAAMTIATAALFAEGETVIRNIYNWRVKETDRLTAMATELRKVGATVEEGEDFIRIQPLPLTQFQHAEIATYNDHRMAMCFSLIALSDTPVTILDPKCTAKTFPTYFTEFEKLSERT